MENSNTLPSIQTLFIDSWNLLLKRFLNLLIFNIISWLLFIGWLIVGLIIMTISGVGLGALSSILHSGSPNIAALLSILPALSIEALVLVTGFALIGALTQIGMILILNDNNQHISFGSVFRQGFRFIIPLFVTGILAFLFIFGGVFVFIIPGIIFGFLFSFYPFEVVLSGKSSLEAIKSSFAIVRISFWQILFRLFLIWVLSAIVTFLTARWIAVTVIINTLLGWFSLCYVFILYKEAKQVQQENVSLKWVFTIAIIGWIMAILAIFGLGGMLSNIKNAPIKSIAPATQNPSSKNGTPSAKPLRQI